jgi:hypothetical protein
VSVSRLIKVREVIDRLNVLVPPFRGRQAAPLLSPHSSSTSPQLIGAAFDYAVRFELERENGLPVENDWTAESAVDILRQYAARDLAFAPALARAAARVKNARVFLRKHLRRRKRDDAWMVRLCRYALKLARLDVLVRRGYIGPDLLARDDDAACMEVRGLLSHVPLERWAGRAPLLLNPGLDPEGLLGGADCDLVAGDELVDFKVTKDAIVERSMVHQLVIYMMLADAQRARGQSFPEVHHLVIYFARHAHVWEMPAADIRANGAYESTRAWLFESAEFLLE